MGFTREPEDDQDFEFTVQDGILHMLQTRSGKRTPPAAARIALDLLDEGLIDTTVALERTSELQEEDLGTVRLASQTDPSSQASPLARAMPACPGVVSAEIAMDGERALARAGEGARIVLVRQDAQTSDIAALEVAAGLLVLAFEFFRVDPARSHGD